MPDLDLFSLLKRKPRALLGWIELAEPMIVTLMARAGFDAVLLDAQHGGHDVASVKAGLTEAARAGVPALVRIEVGAYAFAARALDLGAAGVLAPMIDTAEDAHRFVAEVKYPPLGKRSWGPTRAMQIHGPADGPAFLAGANARFAALAMIETRAGLTNLDAILATPGLDGVLIGPGDLSIALSNGTIDANGPAVRAAMGEILAATRRHGKIACAFAGRPERAAELIEEGFDLVTSGYDTGLIDAAFRQAVAVARG
jgi:4-hydroxy-2-oxoheptanedioate aldolase